MLLFSQMTVLALTYWCTMSNDRALALLYRVLSLFYNNYWCTHFVEHKTCTIWYNHMDNPPTFLQYLSLASTKLLSVDDTSLQVQSANTIT